MNKELEDKLMSVVKDYSKPVAIESLVRCICNSASQEWGGSPPSYQIYQLGYLINNITNQMHQYFAPLFHHVSLMTAPVIEKKNMH